MKLNLVLLGILLGLGCISFAIPIAQNTKLSKKNIRQELVAKESKKPTVLQEIQNKKDEEVLLDEDWDQAVNIQKDDSSQNSDDNSDLENQVVQ